MTIYNRSFALEGGLVRRPRPRIGPLGQRLVRMLLGTEEPSARPDAEPDPDALGRDPETAVAELPDRFPVTRRGYDRAAVDNYIAQLEHELAALDRELAKANGAGSPAAVEHELKRIGEQTSAVLLAANEQRDEILRKARAEAERCVAEAKARANALTAQCEERLRQLRAHNDAAQAERDRLLSELRSISAALATVADSAAVQ